MLKLLFLLAIAIGAVVSLALLVRSRRDRHRRHVGRTRREGDYAERRSQWRTYLTLNSPRRSARITDQRETRD